MPRRPRQPAVPEVRLLLVGMMGSGKTSVGRAISERTGWPYLDNDELLRGTTGAGARDLLEARGVDALRTGEAAVVDRVLEVPPPVVAGVAAGVVLDPEARRRLREAGVVVWLRARPDTLVGRIHDDDARPWTEGDVGDWVREQARTRGPLYAEASDLVVDVDEAGIDELADRILDAVADHSATLRQD